jgi:hypothetical protein
VIALDHINLRVQRGSIANSMKVYFKENQVVNPQNVLPVQIVRNELSQ